MGIRQVDRAAHPPHDVAGAGPDVLLPDLVDGVAVFLELSTALCIRFFV